MNLLAKAKPLKPGYNPIMSPDNYPLKYLKLGRLLLDESSGNYQENTGPDELAVSIFSGRCEIAVDGEQVWETLGDRESILAGKPTMAYIPRQRKWRAKALSPTVDLGVFRATSRRDTEPQLIRPQEIRIDTPGAASWQREVITGIGTNADADRLIVGETYSLPGKWSSYPPHKHDTNAPPKEAWYEEVYHFLLEPKQGFGIQRVYTAPGHPEPIDEVYVVEDGDTVAIPRGYHPVAAAAGYRVAYFWALAGEERTYAAWSDDPKHAWLRDVESTTTTEE